MRFYPKKKRTDAIYCVYIYKKKRIASLKKIHYIYTKEQSIEKSQQMTPKKTQAQDRPTYLSPIYRYINKFAGRKKEKKEIKALLQQPHAMLVLKGIGGIGKTSIAFKIMQESEHLYQYIIWTNCDYPLDSDTDILRNKLLYDNEQLHRSLGIIEQLRETNDEKEKWNILIQSLAQLQGEVLWIIDNAQAKDNKLIRELPYNCHILITSRHELKGITTYNLDILSEKDALKIFKQYCKKTTDNHIIEKINKAAGYHTLSIELLAKLLASLDTMTAREFYEKLQQNLLNDTTRQAVFTHYVKDEMDVRGIIMFAFRLGNLWHEKDIHPLLHTFTLLPYLPTPFLLFQILLEIEEETAITQLQTNLDFLVRQGWIQQTAENTFSIESKAKYRTKAESAS